MSTIPFRTLPLMISVQHGRFLLENSRSMVAHSMQTSPSAGVYGCVVRIPTLHLSFSILLMVYHFWVQQSKVKWNAGLDPLASVRGQPRSVWNVRRLLYILSSTWLGPPPIIPPYKLLGTYFSKFQRRLLNSTCAFIIPASLMLWLRS